MELNFDVSEEQMGSAVLSALLAAARATYTAAVLAAGVTKTLEGLIDARTRDKPLEPNSKLPREERKKFVETSFELVMTSLPADSPFRKPLQELAAAEVSMLDD